MSEAAQKQALDALKVRIFDLGESLTAEQDFKLNFFTELFGILGLEQEQANDVEAYKSKIKELKAFFDAGQPQAIIDVEPTV